jgi:3-oxoacyl-[acyl-carrier protein] reductase
MLDTDDSAAFSGRTSRLAGRIAIVTGAGGGIGGAIARAFGREGAQVVCADLDRQAAEPVARAIVASGGRAVHVEMDHSDADDCVRTVAQALDAFGPPDILVNNAGMAILGTALDVTEEEFLRQLRVNVLGPFLMTRAVLPQMIQQGSGSIVMIASAVGLNPQPAGVAYIASKHAVVGLTKALAVDYAPSGIRVNAICPAVIQTRIADQYIADRAQLYGLSREMIVAELGEQYPLGRIGQPDDVADIAVHFASDESRWVTGATYLLDGGQSLMGTQRAVAAK